MRLIAVAATIGVVFASLTPGPPGDSTVRAAPTAAGINVEWTKTFGKPDHQEEGRGVAVGADRSVYVLLHNDGLRDGGVAYGGKNTVLVKYSTFGNVIWSKTIGGPNDEAAGAVAIGLDQFIYVTGTTSSPRLMGQTSHGVNDIFVAKYSPAGNQIWLRLFGGEGNDDAFGITVVNDGTVLVAGATASEDFATPEPSGGIDGLLLRVSPGGKTVWATRFGGPADDVARGVSFSGDNTVYVGGWTDGWKIGAQEPFGDADMFLLRFAFDGSVVWGRILGGDGIDQGFGVSAAADGTVYLAGTAYSETIAGRRTVGNGDIFLARYSPAGVRLWARVLGGPSLEDGLGVVVHFDRMIHVVGTAYGRVAGATPQGGRDALVARFAPNGDRTDLHLEGGPSEDRGLAIARARDGSLAVAGAMPRCAVEPLDAMVFTYRVQN